MKDIPGTYTERFKMTTIIPFLEREVLEYSDGQVIQVEQLIINGEGVYVHSVAILLQEEELDNAMRHFNFLRKYNLV